MAKWMVTVTKLREEHERSAREMMDKLLPRMTPGLANDYRRLMREMESTPSVGLTSLWMKFVVTADTVEEAFRVGERLHEMNLPEPEEAPPEAEFYSHGHDHPLAGEDLRPVHVALLSH